jgi:hypothetical protein
MSASTTTTPPDVPGGRPSQAAAGVTRRRHGRATIAMAMASTALMTAVSACAGSSSTTDSSTGSVAVVETDPPAATDAPDTTVGPETTMAPETSVAPATTAVVVDLDAVEGAPAGVQGSRSAPVPVGEIADVGDGWRLQVLNVVEDGTGAVLGENQFNDQPPPGARFTLVQVALGYFGTSDPASDTFLTVSGVAAANTELDSDCGVIPNPLPIFADYFAGGVAVGNVCFVTTPSDAGVLQLYASNGFGDNEVFLAAIPPMAPLAPMVGLVGPRDGAAATPKRLDATPIGTAANAGEGWTVTVTGPAFDITDATLAENQFNSPPPAGFRFVAVPVSYAYNGSGSSSGFTVSMRAVADSNISLDTDCGVTPSAIDVFADVFSGGALAGNLCFVVPAEAVGSLVLYGSAGFSGEPVYLAAS